MLHHALRLLVPILVLSTAGPAQAQSLSFTVAPLNDEIVVQPGTQHTGVISVRRDPAAPGDAASSIRLRVYALDWTLDRAGTPQFQKPGTTPGSCSSWLRLNPTELSVAPGETAEIRYTLDVPADATGTLRTIVMFETAAVPPSGSGQANVAVRGRVGSVLYVHAGPQAKRARITGFAVSSEKIIVTVENTGTSHIRMKGVLQFHDAQGKLVEQRDLPAGVALPGPGNLRDLVLDRPKLPGSGKYVVTALIDYGGEALVGARTHVTFP